MAELWTNYGLPLSLIAVHSVAIMVVLLIIVAFLLYADRKIWAAVQMRRGPNVVGPWGLLQSFADQVGLETVDSSRSRWSRRCSGT